MPPFSISYRNFEISHSTTCYNLLVCLLRLIFMTFGTLIDNRTFTILRDQFHFFIEIFYVCKYVCKVYFPRFVQIRVTETLSTVPLIETVGQLLSGATVLRIVQQGRMN